MNIVENPDHKNALSLVIPCYNEAAVIERSLRKIIGFLDDRGIIFEILIGDDGSTDNTGYIVRSVIEEDKRVKILKHAVNKGKGAILSSTFPHARNGFLAFIDADLEIDIHYLEPLLGMVENGADIAIGSKGLTDGQVQRSRRRRTATRGYNILVGLLLNSRLSDHQAGIKVFKRDVLLDILHDVSNDGWTWDTEVLVRAQKKGYNISEYPVQAARESGSKISFIKHSIQMARDVFAMYSKRLRINGNDAKGEVVRYASEDRRSYKLYEHS